MLMTIRHVDNEDTPRPLLSLAHDAFFRQQRSETREKHQHYLVCIIDAHEIGIGRNGRSNCFTIPFASCFVPRGALRGDRPVVSSLAAV